ncbi:MAG TPA: serine--tRNA ligase [Candidatus Saccharimonadales bacterium]|nr:serine--tRNA ligase [Candidatus Saccharimonadales bacterium]
MLDIQFIRENADRVKQNAEAKNIKVDVDALLAKDEQRRRLLQQIEPLRQERNSLAESAKGQKPTDEQIAKGKELKEKLASLEDELQKVETDYLPLLKLVPNMAWEDVPVGSSEDENVVAKTVGEPTKFDFEPKNHWEIAQAKGWIDKERAAKVAGARFVYVKGDLVLLEQALWQFAYSVLTNEAVLQSIIEQNGLKVTSKPFVPVLPPAVAKTEVYDATGRLDKEETTYKLVDDDLWLNASAEHTLAPMYFDEILPEAELPIRYVGYTTAFRREAGTYGKDMEGILRLHQFNKLEMESFTAADTSFQEHLFMIAVQEHLMQQLGLPYQVIMKCTADIGGPNARGLDINTWLPGQNKYRETHTADYMTDYQSRRMRTRIRKSDGSIELAHTNDATAFSERPLVAIIENYQTEEGNVRIPEVLLPYMQNRGEI